MALDLQRRLDDALTAQSEAAHEPGGAFCVVRRGEVVAESVWGTVDGTRPWTSDTLVMCYSVAKPIAALALVSVVAEGRLGLDEPVTEVWPEYAAHGKGATTVRHLLSHRAGLSCFPESAAGVAFDDTTALTTLLAAAPPEHPPGAAIAEHALTYGHLLGEVVRRATGETLEDRWARLAAQAGWDLHLRVAEPDEGRVATVETFTSTWATDYLADPRWGPALGRPPGLLDPAVLNTRRWRTTPFAAINLHASARGIADFFADLADPRGHTAGLLGPELLAEYVAPQAVGHDRVLDRDVTWTLGPQLDPGELGMGGAGGCAGWVSLELGYAAGQVTRGLGGGDAADVGYEVVESAIRAEGNASA